MFSLISSAISLISWICAFSMEFQSPDESLRGLSTLTAMIRFGKLPKIVEEIQIGFLFGCKFLKRHLSPIQRSISLRPEGRFLPFPLARSNVLRAFFVSVRAKRHRSAIFGRDQNKGFSRSLPYFPPFMLPEKPCIPLKVNEWSPPCGIRQEAENAGNIWGHALASPTCGVDGDIFLSRFGRQELLGLGPTPPLPITADVLMLAPLGL